GARLYAASGSPLGRPRCEIATTLAPASVSLRIVATDARILPSSVMRLPSSGTLRSHRTIALLPARSPRLARVRNVIAPFFLRKVNAGGDGGGPPSSERRRLEALGHVLCEVHEAVGVAPLVVVPARELDLVAQHTHEVGVEDAGVRVGRDV